MIATEKLEVQCFYLKFFSVNEKSSSVRNVRWMQLKSLKCGVLIEVCFRQREEQQRKKREVDATEKLEVQRVP